MPFPVHRVSSIALPIAEPSGQVFPASSTLPWWLPGLVFRSIDISHLPSVVVGPAPIWPFDFRWTWMTLTLLPIAGIPAYVGTKPRAGRLQRSAALLADVLPSAEVVAKLTSRRAV